MGAKKQTKGRADRRQERQAPPPGTTAAGQDGGKEGTPPPGTCMAGAVRAANGLIPGCRGRSPLHEITLVSPFPPGRGSGDGGRKEGKGRGQQAARKASPPPGTCMAGAVRAANGLIPGCRGRSPRQNKLIVSPFPGGEGGWGGWGQERR